MTPEQRRQKTLEEQEAGRRAVWKAQYQDYVIRLTFVFEDKPTMTTVTLTVWDEKKREIT